jgi:glycosyltransferase involved in cell wall biosynthesis
MNKSDKTLVILTPGFPKDETDTTCLPLQQQLVKALQESNPKLKIIILSFQYPYHTKKYRWFNTIVRPFNGRNKGGIPRLLLRRKLNAALKKIHSQTPIHGLLSFWYGECALVGHRFADLHGLKHFCWLLGQDAKKENKYPHRAPLRPGELIALSDFLQTEFERNHGIKPGHLIPAGIDPKQFNTIDEKKNIDILGVGSLIPLKQYDLFIETVAGIKKQLPAIKAMLIGSGPEMDKIKDLIKQSALETTITITGELPYTEVLHWMQRAKLLLHPSSYEGFSGVCLEALYAGAHVISFCKAMTREVEQWHMVRSKEEMKEKAIFILQNPATIYKRVTFASMEDVAKKMTDLFFD